MNNPRNPRRLFVCLALCLLLPAHAGFTLVEDFQTKALGNVGGQHGWIASNATCAQVIADPVVVGNKVLHRAGNGGASLSSLAIPQGTTATFFFRVCRLTANNDEVWGISDVSSPDLGGNFGVFEAQGGISGANIRGRNVGPTVDKPIVQGTWYNVWMVINNSSDTWQFYLQSEGDSTYKNQTQILNNTGGTGFGFRNAPGTNALVAFLTKSTNGANTSVYYDDLYVDTAAANLTLPPIPGTEPRAVSDAVEVSIGGGTTLRPLANDTGIFDPASLQLVSSPAHGTASYDANRRIFIYKHTGTTAGVDSFRYRISNAGGTQPSEGDVNVTISGNFRLANVTATVPADPPAAAAGGLAIIDAMPGLSFPNAVAMTSVPGTPSALLVASVNGSIWYVPDSTAAVPVKHLVLDVASLSNFTRGRSIYSIECFPDFATTGHIVVNYQGDSTRLPVPSPGQTLHDVMSNLDKNGGLDPVIECDLRVSRFTLSPAHLVAAADGLSAAESSAVMATEWPYLNLAEQHLFHSINDAKFGPDGYLYITFGDEGDQGDPYRNGQRLTKDFYSSLIRIDVNPASTNPKPNLHYAIAVGGLNGLESPNTPYTSTAQEPNFRVPLDNPFVHTSLGGSWNGSFDGADFSGQLSKVRTEMWAVGLRNPFKFHLDVEDGTGATEAWIGDVGKDAREEFSILKKGENGGWSYYEGDIVTPGLAFVPPQPSGTTPHKPPLFAYPHSNGNNSATGGIYYRDSALPTLTNRYICGDYGSGRIWSISRDGSSVIELTDLRLSTNRIVDFHVDPVTKGIFVLENGGSNRLMRITVQPPGPEDYPATLSELGLFADLADLTPNPGVVPYEPNLTFWSDGAEKKRWFVIKNLTDTIGWSQDGNWSFPDGMVWVKHFDFDLDRSNPGTLKKRLETRVLVRNSSGSYGVSYRWNEAGTEATLVPNSGEDFTVSYADENGVAASVGWHIPSRAECLSCHTATAGHALSMSTRQFNLQQTIHGQTGNLLTLLSNGGYLNGLTAEPVSLPRFYRPDETGAGIEERVRSYLAVNCSYCHQPGGGTPESWDARGHLTLEQTGLLYSHPVSEATPDLTDHIIRPGDKANSALWNKINARSVINGIFNGYSQMPPLATNVFDAEGIALIGEWIDHHANVAPMPAEGSIGQTNLSENESAGHVVGLASADDPDVREDVADQSLLTYTITAGNERGLFSLDASSGELRLNGIIDFERQSQHQLTVEVADHFAPNPGVLERTVIVDLIDEASPDLTEDSDENGLFDAWELSFGVSSPSSDDDHDGVAAFFELLSGGDPNTAETPSLLGLAHALPGDHELGWNVRTGFVLGEDYHVELSGDLGEWGRLQAVDYAVESITPVSPGVSRVVIKVPAAGSQQFLRLSSP
ncbi:cadherin domain-containing protein [Luteolibacter arcticus]|uniref:Cadherin domain-containing protein n=1 Tax=Luteolibacter arcticus TaxID=1581411 RepID=A0ABT3GIK3_9BACT|nr:cadherin domain-containing protein [Luteolibacter arcticus]MCW1923324.1 cadherin domain-containing protein [Luteolibacter arcticus]